ncbi:hypothetical protein AB0J74_07235 [Asanoa sp. NPDC049573]|uniref:hypothetical protein n=1 Tax=Asanoa sp. NPDC049573 TaxID=3155396 RepID=UPI00344541C8
MINTVRPIGDVRPSAAEPVGAVGTYTPVTPRRILDTRSGLGAPKRIVGPGGIVHLQVGGRGGVPATGVSAVILNLTVTGTQGNGYLTAYPDGVTRPIASSINFTKGATRANSVTVAVGANGYVNIYQNSLGAHILADVAGYYSVDEAAPIGSTYFPQDPFRLGDTRQDPEGAVPGGGWIRYAITFGNAADDASVTAIAMNVTAINPVNGGYLTTWNGVGDPPVGVSAVNYAKGGITPNSATVPTAICEFCTGGTGYEPMFGVYTNTTTHWIVDVFGVYAKDENGLKFRPVTPQRILDTRQTTAMRSGVRVVDSPASVTPETYALSLNVAGVTPTANTYLTVWPNDGSDRPAVSTLNPYKGQTVANGTIAGLGDNQQFQIYNNSGVINVVADMGGVFEYFPPVAQGARVAPSGPDLRRQARTAASNR